VSMENKIDPADATQHLKSKFGSRKTRLTDKEVPVVDFMIEVVSVLIMYDKIFYRTVLNAYILQSPARRIN
jgi:hypothetical protein